MSMSPAFHLLGKAMKANIINENEVKTIIGVIRKDEQKRIIKLLEPLAEHYEECYYNGEPCCYAEECSANVYGYAIKLIKGEKK